MVDVVSLVGHSADRDRKVLLNCMYRSRRCHYLGNQGCGWILVVPLHLSCRGRLEGNNFLLVLAVGV